MKTKIAPLVYESLCKVNRSFEEILREFERLKQFEWFRGPSPIKSVELAVKETHAWTMFEILDVLQKRQENEWMRLGRIRATQDKRFERRDEVQTKPADRKRRSASRV
jgi:hypothetical protein